MNVSPNWTVDEVLEWLGDRFADRDEALRAIEQAAEAGAVLAIARDDDAGGKRVEIEHDEWIDNALTFSEQHAYWLLAPDGWQPWQNVVSDEISLYPGPRLTAADFEHDPLFAEPRWHDVRFRAESICQRWTEQRNSTSGIVTKGVDIKRAVQALIPHFLNKGENFSKREAEPIRIKFGISKKQFQSRVWPDAREQAGLPRLGRGGAKPKAGGQS